LYRYTLAETYKYNYDFSKLFANNDLQELRNEWGVIYPDSIEINEEYSWDGCSGPAWQGKTIEPEEWMPVVKEGGYRYATTLAASLVHDFTCQFTSEIRRKTGLSYGVVRKVSDDVFYDVLKKSKFRFRKLYYAGVRVWGWMMGAKNSLIRA